MASMDLDQEQPMGKDGKTSGNDDMVETLNCCILFEQNLIKF